MQVGMMAKEKGVAMRDNAASYQQSLQRETEVRSVANNHCSTYPPPLPPPPSPLPPSAEGATSGERHPKGAA